MVDVKVSTMEVVDVKLSMVWIVEEVSMVDV